MRVFIGLFFLLFLWGCQTQLFSSLPEGEINDMWSILQKAGIKSTKTSLKDNLAALSVDSNFVSSAIDILRLQGYPRSQFANIGDLFPKEGLISSPMEEKVRFLYGLSQELSATISHIDGVLSARVHLVLPENTSQIETTIKPSSAAIFIKHQPVIELESYIPQIKLLVANSVENLSYDQVSVALFPSISPSIEPVPAQSNKRLLVGIVIFLLLAVAGAVGAFLWWKKKKQTATS